MRKPKAPTGEHPIDTAMRGIKRAFRDVPHVPYRDRHMGIVGQIKTTTHLELEVTPVLMKLWEAAVEQAEWNLRRLLRSRTPAAVRSARSATRRRSTAGASVIGPRK